MKDEARSFVSGISGISGISRALGLNNLRDVWPVWLALGVITSVPYVVANLRTPQGTVFTGVLSAYDDTFTYFAWIRQSADGHLLLSDLFTSEPQSREFFLPLWNIIGFTTRLTGVSVVLMFHIARLLAGLLLLMAARAVAQSMMKSRVRVRYTLWLYAMSGGLGWLVYALKNRHDLLGAVSIAGSVDLNIPEAIAFRSVFAQVHFAVGIALLCYAIKIFFSALVENKTSRAFGAGLLGSLLALVHPYMIVVVVSTTFVTVLTRGLVVDKSKDGPRNYMFHARTLAAFGAALIPGVGYLLYLNRTNEVLREWLRVTDTLSPAPQEYLLGFGFVAALAAVGFRLLWSNRSVYGRLLLIWALVQAALLYAPISFQRRLVEGLQLPLAIAASSAVFWIARKLFSGRVAPYRKIYLTAVIAICSITNLGFIVGQLAPNGAPGSADSRRYVPVDLVAAFEWLRQTDSDAVLFSHYLTGNLAPSMTGLRVFLGHYGQTINAEEKGAQVTAFYTGAIDDAFARQLFAKNGVRYVIYGPFERASYDVFVPPRWLRLARRFGDVDVFEVNQEAMANQIDQCKSVESASSVMVYCQFCYRPRMTLI